MGRIVETGLVIVDQKLQLTAVAAFIQAVAGNLT